MIEAITWPARFTILNKPTQVLPLQRLVGDRAIPHLIQILLTVDPARDRYEQEADQAAQQVMAMPAPI